MTDYGLGRRPSPQDPRDSRYPARALLPARLPAPRERAWGVYWGWRLDQGQTGTCVGHAGKHLLLARPLVQTRPGNGLRPGLGVTAFDLYVEACRRDIWPENDPTPDHPLGDVQFGTSVRALAQVLKEFGFITSYHWATTSGGADLDWEAARSWLCHQGPLVLGINWLESMFQPGAGALLRVDRQSGVAGGHALLADGYDPTRMRVRLLNSWGLEWGQRGQAWIREADLVWLLAQPWAECLVATEVRA